jgi:hypothetical protein
MRARVFWGHWSMAQEAKGGVMSGAREEVGAHNSLACEMILSLLVRNYILDASTHALYVRIITPGSTLSQ